jgi:hypothetical protein
VRRPKGVAGLAWCRGVCWPYVGLVADDVDHIRGELVNVTITVHCHVLLARRWSVLVAVVIAALGEAVVGDTAGGQ